MLMDVNVSSFTILSIILFTFLIWLFRSKSKSNLKFPPGPRKLPLIGNLHLLVGSRPPHRTLGELAAKYGPLMRLQLGEIPTLVVTSPGFAKEFLNTHDVIFASRPSLLVSEILNHGNTNIAFAKYGEYWRQLRKICTIELLSTRRVQSLRPLREEEFSKLCRWIGSRVGSRINLTENVESTTFDVFMKASIGQTMSEKDMFITKVKESVDLAGGFVMADVYPSIRLFRLLSPLRFRLEKLKEILDSILENIINEHKVASAESKQGEEDLLDVLLKFNQVGHELYLTKDNIKAVLKDVFLAGIETSSTTIDWAMAELLQNPRVLEKVQHEVRQVFDKKGFVDESDLDKLKYMKLVIKETLRLHPPMPLLIPRESTERCEVQGYEIPAKTRVMVNVWAMGRDPEYWKDAKSFEPKRYVDNPVDYKGKNFEYIPFGSGRRICPGITFGLAIVELLLAMLLYHFDWVLPEGMKPENVDMTEAFSITARRKVPLHVVPILQRPLLFS